MQQCTTTALRYEYANATIVNKLHLRLTDLKLRSQIIATTFLQIQLQQKSSSPWKLPNWNYDRHYAGTW